MSQPLLIDQHIGSATYIETMRDEFIFNSLSGNIHDMYDDLFLIHFVQAFIFFDLTLSENYVDYTNKKLMTYAVFA